MPVAARFLASWERFVWYTIDCSIKSQEGSFTKALLLFGSWEVEWEDVWEETWEEYWKETWERILGRDLGRDLKGRVGTHQKQLHL